MARIRGRRKAEQWLAEWQADLGLGGWSIGLAWCPGSKGLDDSCHLAECSWVADRGEATVHLRPPLEIKSLDDSVEETIIHELLHLRFDGHRPLDEADTSDARELALNVLSKALRRRKYRGALPEETF